MGDLDMMDFPQVLMTISYKLNIYFIYLCLWLPLVVTFSACDKASNKSEGIEKTKMAFPCPLSQPEAEHYLGVPAKYIDKTDPKLGIGENEKQDPNVVTCGFIADDLSYIYWYSKRFDNEDLAKGSFEDTKQQLSAADKPGATDYWEDDTPAIVDGAFMTHGYHENAFRVDFAGRVENIAFTIKTNNVAERKTSFVLLKGMAVMLSRKLPTTPR
jgi:hypothetical protein